jgi:hypothetical protein
MYSAVRMMIRARISAAVTVIVFGAMSWGLLIGCQRQISAGPRGSSDLASRPTTPQVAGGATAKPPSLPAIPASDGDTSVAGIASAQSDRLTAQAGETAFEQQQQEKQHQIWKVAENTVYSYYISLKSSGIKMRDISFTGVRFGQEHIVEQRVIEKSDDGFFTINGYCTLGNCREEASIGVEGASDFGLSVFFDAQEGDADCDRETVIDRCSCRFVAYGDRSYRAPCSDALYPARRGALQAALKHFLNEQLRARLQQAPR